MIASALLVTNEYPPEKIAGTAINTQFVAEELAARDVRVSVVVNTRQHAPAREVHRWRDTKKRHLPIRRL